MKLNSQVQWIAFLLGGIGTVVAIALVIEPLARSGLVFGTVLTHSAAQFDPVVALRG
jgi:hypothetical protein